MGDGVHALLSGDDGRVGGVLLPNVAISVARTAADHELTPNRMPLHRHRESPLTTANVLCRCSHLGLEASSVLRSAAVYTVASAEMQKRSSAWPERTGLRPAIPRESMTEWPAT
jgi:hypothetical protein